MVEVSGLWLAWLSEHVGLVRGHAELQLCRYPRVLDKALALERARLEKRRELLRSQPDVAHAAMADLVLPPELALADETVSNEALDASPATA